MISAVSGALLLLQSLVLAAQLESDDRCGLTTGGQARLWTEFKIFTEPPS